MAEVKEFFKRYKKAINGWNNKEKQTIEKYLYFDLKKNTMPNINK